MTKAIDILLISNQKTLFEEMKSFALKKSNSNILPIFSLNEIQSYETNDLAILIVDADNCKFYNEILLNLDLRKKFLEIIVFTNLPLVYDLAVSAIKCGATSFCHQTELLAIVDNYFVNQSEIVNAFKSKLSMVVDDLKEHLSFDKVFNLVPTGIFFINAKNNNIIEVNSRVVEFFGIPKDKMLSSNMKDLHLWFDENDYYEFINSVKTEKEVRYKEYKFNKKNGAVNTVLLSADLYEYDNESIIVISGFDISERVAASIERKNALSKQTELTKLKGTFISMISHEFRTPLTTIQLSTDLLKRYSDRWNEEERNKHFDRIQATVLKMTKLMENVLIIGKIESGQFVPKLENLDLSSYCNEISEGIEFNTMGTHKIQFSYNHNDFITNIDENLIGLILNNILTNAVKYSPKNSVVEFSLLQTENEATMVVKDYGMGIPAEDLPNLFHSFYRAKNVGPIDGYGLGLALVQMCVEAHKGSIEVESTLGESTTFTVKIPTNLTHDNFSFKIS